MNTEKILSQFKDYLEEAQVILPSDERSVDLYAFFKALAELKTETKRSSKQVQSSLISFKEAFSLMEKQLGSQEEIRKSLQKYHEAEIDRIKHTHILELIDIYDRVDRNINQSQNLLFKLKKKWFNGSIYKQSSALSNGMKLSLEHVKHSLVKKGVNKIDTAGAFFNPKLMKIVEVEHHPEIKNMVVLEEVVAGYTDQNNQPVRCAEVIVNRHRGINNE